MAARTGVRSARKRMSPEDRANAKKKRDETRFRNSAKEIFAKSGFVSISSEGREFKFSTPNGDRTGELDGIFVYENVLILLEDTCAATPGPHLNKKLMFFELALKNPARFVSCLRDVFPEFERYFSARAYQEEDFVLRFVYFSMYSVDSEYVEAAARAEVRVVERALTNYFSALVKNIAASAKYEIFKFLDIPYSEIGEEKLRGGNSDYPSRYNGFLLPEANSSYPEGYKIVSFYADPASLLKKSFVLRKNGWLAPNLSYQRILDVSKIRLMRRYLTEDKRVFLGNIIATLPSSTKIGKLSTADQLSLDDQRTVKAVKITLPDEYNVIGLVDGQHRVYSYHEGNDAFEKEINRLRTKQNLLVTGIIYPEYVSDEERTLFEAKLFLEINSRQTKVKSALTQEIELIVNPFSTTAIAKAVLVRLAKKGALKDRLEEHVFDDVKKLKVSSIIGYGLKPLVKKEGGDSLFDLWGEDRKKVDIFTERNREHLEEFVDFCASEINDLLISVKVSCSDAWYIGHDKKLLTPTSINGFLKCLRLIIEKRNVRGIEEYKKRLANIGDFDFSTYKSSHWNQLGTDLYANYFAS
ncbi:DGQHR domain-containing protein [Jeongeupia chitinilytica]|uniref:DGQHR domain-containing protein n=1 Tax=Jeongeupia chitinilytica TaxID=1041641 RepID=A0ABQ3H0H9_9NEIS|nr:DGQHR domain-containing protein [Jeongeupia chitinilytica]GHD60294.1 hypothetical protein GCM10007350_13110 [Jeongeupia chitinilytica]